MIRYKNLLGQRFGRLTVKALHGRNKAKNILWECKCDCGNKVIVSGHCLLSGNTKSCGCLQKEKATKTLMDITITHGLSRDKNHAHTRLFRIWQGIKTRCLDVNDKTYSRYGARGIKICDEWLHDFKTFYDWAMANGYKSNLTIDRINNDGNYEPSNCRWVSKKVQDNNRRNNKYFNLNGVTKTMAEWAETYGIDYHTLAARVERGWRIEKALTAPINTNCRNKTLRVERG